jgi:hypothetical protein
MFWPDASHVAELRLTRLSSDPHQAAGRTVRMVQAVIKRGMTEHPSERQAPSQSIQAASLNELCHTHPRSGTVYSRW